MPIVKGYAIISRNGMIAYEDGSFPGVLKRPGDQHFFRSGVRAADVIVHGRHSGEDDADTADRPRLILTRKIPSLALDPTNDHAVQWNPRGASFSEAWRCLGSASDAVAAVLGGTEVFDLFLDIGYDVFYLSCFLDIGYDVFYLSCADVSVMPGRQVFSGTAAPQTQLQAQGLVLRSRRELDADPRVLLEEWHTQRPGRHLVASIT
ncbi:dihydrofolate reductase [Reyranella sp. CPCC 100927]|uniref:dihydrofolate reductase n=1 Tax=Reyranella sp. CPCC 100927 TaxID=2599616 RepID=UPI0011B54A77|nr:dihydrofolate reductase [Reyranella sp. CPCC 100927]TWT03114.1 dihydrofolate reductase [Reyranella sp. CPCC 100927]